MMCTLLALGESLVMYKSREPDAAEALATQSFEGEEGSALQKCGILSDISVISSYCGITPVACVSQHSCCLETRCVESY